MGKIYIIEAYILHTQLRELVKAFYTLDQAQKFCDSFYAIQKERAQISESLGFNTGLPMNGQQISDIWDKNPEKHDRVNLLYYQLSEMTGLPFDCDMKITEVNLE